MSISFDFKLQLFSGLSDVLMRLQEPLIYVCDFRLELLVAFCPVHFQKKWYRFSRVSGLGGNVMTSSPT